MKIPRYIVIKLEMVGKDTVKATEITDRCEIYEYEADEDEPQTETEIAKAIVHKMIDNSVIADDAYPDLKQRMHEAVERLDEYYPPKDERSDQ